MHCLKQLCCNCCPHVMLIRPREYLQQILCDACLGAADGAGPSTNGDIKDGQPTSRELFFKTRLCDKFMQFGDCPYGDRCHYAHGYQDLREKGSVSVRPCAACSCATMTSQHTHMKVNWPVLLGISNMCNDWELRCHDTMPLGCSAVQQHHACILLSTIVASVGRFVLRHDA